MLNGGGEKILGRGDFSRRDRRVDRTDANSLRAARVQQEIGARQNVSTPSAVRAPWIERPNPEPRRGRGSVENVRDQ